MGLVVLSLASGHSARYLTEAVAAGRENYYTGAVAAGEPPGRWYGAGAAKFGLTGLVDAQDMIALYERFLDPSDPNFKDPDGWDETSTLGHTGLNYPTAAEIYKRLLDAEPGADAERREQLRVQASKDERHNVAFHDATFNVQKSITVLHTAFEAMQVKAQNNGGAEEAAAWGEFKKAVEDAIWAGNKAAVDYLAEHGGYTRVGSWGGGKGGRWADAHDLTIASFFQHDSRDHDPHLHIHNAILNRVQGPDGQWITLDSKALYAAKPAAGALAERVTQEYLSAAIGIQFRMRPDGKAREIVGIPQAVMDLFSSRRRAITPKIRELAEAFEAKHGKAPNALQLHNLAQQATLATRRAKSHIGQTREEMLESWEARLRAEIDGGLAKVARDALAARPADRTPDTWLANEVIATALASLQEKRASFTESDLISEISAALPDHLGITDGKQIAELLTGLKNEALKFVVTLDAEKPGDEVLPDKFHLANGTSVFDAPGRKRYATTEHLHSEQLLREATLKRDAGVALSSDAAQRFLKGLSKAGIELGDDQAAAIEGVLTSGARIESLVGPAGTGKSFVVGILTKAWQDPALWQQPDGQPSGQPGGRARRVVGLATSQNAAEVLTAEGVNSTNTARWLAIQKRLLEGRAKPEDQPWELRAGDLVVIDESSMADTQSLDAVRARVEAVGAKMLPTGDYRQLGAPGAGGGMELMAEAGNAYELTDARRFTNAWEREASLRLRACDATVLEDYHKNGRILDAGSIEQAEHSASRAWLADTLAGKHSLLLVDTNNQAARINGDLHAEMVKLGRVAEQGLRLGHDENFAGVGDVVRGRRLAWELVGYRGNKRPPMTSEQYRVLETRDDGSMVVAPIRRLSGEKGGEELGARMMLSPDYVAKDLALGYALTEHGVQGAAADTGHGVVTTRTKANALYPQQTRGRDSNTMHVVTQSAATGIDAETGDTAHAPRRNPKALLEEILESAHPEQSATAMAAQDAADTANVQTPIDRFRATCEVAVTERTARWLDELTATGELTVTERRRLAAEGGGKKLSPLLQRLELAGHNARQVLAAAVSGKSFAGAHGISSVIYGRITTRNLNLDPHGERWTDWTPKTGDPQYDRYLTSLAQTADNRTAELGAQTAQQPPEWALAAFGPVPADPEQRASWVDRAGHVAAYRELMNLDDPTNPANTTTTADAIGRPPKPGLVEPHTAWRAAWRALGRPDTISDEQQMTDGRLQLRVRAYQREQTWAPPNVANMLAGSIQTAERYRRTATLRRADAQASTDPAEKARLEREATDAIAVAEAVESELPRLRAVDETRGQWVEHTASTRAAAERAEAELAKRSTDNTAPEPRVTAEEWLTADRHAVDEEDTYREITEADLIDLELHDTNTVTAADVATEEDVREAAARDTTTVDEDTVHTPNALESQTSVDKARRAVQEMHRRAAADQQAEEDSRYDQTNHWHTLDHQADHNDHRDTGAAL